MGRRLFSLETSGLDHLPGGPFVVAANHAAHVDAVFLGTAVTQPIRFLAAADLVGINRGMDFFLPFYGAILLPRTGVPFTAMKTALHHLRDGGRVGLFPEGRRSERWGSSSIYHGAAWLAERASVPLVPIALVGTEQVMGLEDRRIYRSPVQVRIGEPLSPTGDHRTLTSRWQESMNELLAKPRSGSA